jgi:hypothetical protein
MQAEAERTLRCRPPSLGVQVNPGLHTAAAQISELLAVRITFDRLIDPYSLKD